jgi:hypothetical protein
MIGATAGTGTITLGRSTATNTVSIGSGSPGASATQTISIGNGVLATASSNITVNVLSGTAGSNGTATLNLANNDRVTAVNIGNVAADAARTLNLFTGDNTVGVDTLNIGTGNTSVAGGKAINIGTGTPTGSGTNIVIIGSTSTSSTTALQGGTVTMKGGTGANTTTLSTGTPSGTNTIDLPAETGVVCLRSSVACGFLTGGTGDFIQNGTAIQTPANFAIRSAAIGSVGGVIQGASGQTADIFQVQTWNGSSATSVLTVGNTGLVTVGAGLTATGTTLINASSNNNTSINTGTSNGTITLGGSSAPLVIDSTAFDVSNTGALSGISTIATSSTINSQTISSAAIFTGTVTIQGASSLTLGTASTNTGSILFKGGGGAGTLTLAGPTTPNVGNFTLSIPAITGNATICTDNVICAGYAAGSGSGSYIQNQNAGQQAASNFWISAVGRADTALRAPLFDTATAVVLNMGTTNATAINLGGTGVLTTNSGSLTVNQLLTASGGITVAANQNVTMNTGSGVFTQTHTSALASSAQVLSATNTNSGGSSIAVNAQSITVVGTATSGGINTNSALRFANPSAATNNVFYALNFAGTGYTDILRVGSTQIMNGSGLVQNAAIDSTLTYSNLTKVGALNVGSIASGFGTIATANTITGTTLNGTTGINTGASAGTQRIDVSGNLVNIGSITSIATATWSTSAGDLTLQAAGILNVGTGGGTAINVGTNNAAHTIGIGNTGATGTQAITIGGSGNVNNTIILEAGTGATGIQIGNGATNHGIQVGTGAGIQAVTIGSTNTSSSTTIQGGTGHISLLTNAAAASILAKSNTNGAAAFQVQNSGGAAYLTIDTLNAQINIGDTIATASIRVGDATNNMTFAATTHQPTLNGTARYTKRVTLVPEYAGATFTGDGSNNSGSMSSDFCSNTSPVINTTYCPTSGDRHNYYRWVSASGSNDYDIYIRYQMPSDFSAFPSGGTINMYGWRTLSPDGVDLTMFEDSGAQCGTTTNVATGTATWTEEPMAGTITGCGVTANEIVIFHIRLKSVGASNSALAGELRFDYLAKF